MKQLIIKLKLFNQSLVSQSRDSLTMSWCVFISLIPCGIEKTWGITCDKMDHLWQPYLVQGDHYGRKNCRIYMGEHLWWGTNCDMTDLKVTSFGWGKNDHRGCKDVEKLQI